ncbi:hypothetical protein BTN50_0483 [Candidatus Enterovibrio altilux]|uniref:Uncharacterized protein n=1 Tax=Candidatus Enterovibrio altilux TaxID=1927128 RepID=A0A291B7N6_9GAMM|nr:hypothetical protein BTN50_0483 [Candidatus Enterovibrio luxaltus]
MHEIIASELSASNATNSEVLSTGARLVEKSMKYQSMVLTTPSNLTKPFVLNEWFHSTHQDKKRNNF